MTIISLIEIFGVAVTAIGGLEGIKYIIQRKQEARKAKAGADKEEVSAEKALRDMYEESIKEMKDLYESRIHDLHDNITSENKEILEMRKEIANKESIISDKTTQIREINEKRIQEQKHISKLQRELDFYKSWKCFREFGNKPHNCKRREPEQNPPIKYTPLEND